MPPYNLMEKQTTLLTLTAS